MTTVIAKTVYKGGIEGTLQGFGEFIFGLGFVIIFGLIVFLGFTAEILEVDSALITIIIIIGIIGSVQLFIFSALFRAAADALRLLKKQNGLNYSGEISAAQGTDYYQCSECGNQIESVDKECQYCKKGSASSS